MQQQRETKMWEFKTLRTSATGGFLGGKFDETALDVKLNAMGEQRWELVAAFTTNQGYGQSREIVTIFRRERR